ncbi:MAG: DUF3526 domain-containing protein [Bacteroidota bacterium]
MIFRIVQKETISMLRDGRYKWTAGLLVVLLSGALIAGWQHFEKIESQRSYAQQTDREMWVGQGEKNQHSAAHFGVYAFKPTSPLSALDQGVLQYTGVSVFMEAHSVQDATYRPADDATAVQRLGNLTASLTLQVLLPLLIILLTFGTFSGEREQGTLRQLLSLGVSRWVLTLGKGLGVTAPLLLMLIPATLIGIAAVALSTNDGSVLWDGGRILMMVATYILYFSIYIIISLLVSALAASSRQALVILLGFWMFISFIGPRLVTDAADSKYPVPTASTFSAAIQEDMDALPSWTKRTETVQVRLMEEHKVDSVAAIPASVAGHTLLEAERDETEVYRKHFEALGDVHHQQEQFTQKAAFLSPVLAVQLASMGFAGSDYLHHRHFAKAAETYRYDFVQTLNQDLVDAQASWDYEVGQEMWEKIPPFSYELPAVGEVLSHYVPSLVVLIVWNIALLLVAPVVIANMKIG